MADKSVGELIAAQSVTPTDLFVLEQNGTAKKLTGQVLENWLVSFADGHGGIQNIEKVKTSGLVDTYRITLADTTTFDFMVTNGKGINSVSKVSTSGLVDTYRIAFNDGTSSTFTVTNGEKGDKGDNQYVWIKYASQKPTATSHSFGDVADDWIGIYSGSSDTAPTDWTKYEWFKIKGEKGYTGEPATLVSSSVTYQVGDSGTIIPSGSWIESIPPVSQGKYLWTREITQFNTGNPITKYSVSRFGIDGSGSVSTVAGVSPDAIGNVPLSAADVKALPIAGGTMEGSINMNGQSLSGLNTPTKDDEAATKGYVDELKNDTETYVNNAVRTAAPRNLLDNSYFANPVNQRGVAYGATQNSGYVIDRWYYEQSAGAGDGYFGLTEYYISLKAPSDGYSQMHQNLERFDRIKGETFTFATSIQYGNTRKGVKTVTFTMGEVGNGLNLTEDGNVKLYSVDGMNVLVRVTGQEEYKFIWAVLYEGEYTAETLPVYQPKGYGVELAECQRYYQVIDISGLPGMFISGTKFITKCPNTVPMRVFPTLIELLKDNIVTHNPSGSQLILPVKQYILEKGTNGYKIAIESEGAYTYFPGMIFSGKIALSAGL